ncbi:hypothetical protein F4818DRAFT_383627 [Hypoxylon cercidicola]|nr:hypothetical protein F4818DRAFT_383627 [Hypoxylon cercidicola]
MTFSNHTSFNDGCSEQEPESLDGGSHDYYTDNYTSDRPPHLNDDNFPSTQPGGYGYQPRRPPSVHPSELNLVTDPDTDYTVPSSGSANTDGTVREGDVFARRAYIGHYVSYDYHNPVVPPPLTTDTIAALDHSNETQPYNGDIYNWLPGAGYSVPNDTTNNWSTQANSSYNSHSSVATNRSWTMVPTAHDPQAENINGIGGWQADITADPETILARIIPDEDTED